jgi:hypothetical protein
MPVVVLAVTAGLAACGSSSSSTSTAASAGTQAQARLNLAKCFRAHGINVPDPSSGGGGAAGGGGLFRSLQGYSAQISSARQACRQYFAQAFPRLNLSPAQQAQFRAQIVKFAQCMRSHGVPDFPDPTGGRLLLQSKKGSSGSLHPDSPQFKAASQACKSLSPAGLGSGQTVSPQVQAQALKFARCMRSHGVPSFPDPSFTGGGIRIQAPGTNLSSPAFKRAQQECGSLLPGGAP